MEWGKQCTTDESSIAMQGPPLYCVHCDITDMTPKIKLALWCSEILKIPLNKFFRIAFWNNFVMFALMTFLLKSCFVGLQIIIELPLNPSLGSAFPSISIMHIYIPFLHFSFGQHFHFFEGSFFPLKIFFLLTMTCVLFLTITYQ